MLLLPLSLPLGYLVTQIIILQYNFCNYKIMRISWSPQEPPKIAVKRFSGVDPQKSLVKGERFVCRPNQPHRIKL